MHAAGKPVVTRKDIYHDGWIDLNKNGRKDILRRSTQPEEKRLDDLIGQMTLDEKTAQCATLYGYKRVLKDYLPTEGWKDKHCGKTVSANIDEHLTGISVLQPNPTCPAWRTCGRRRSTPGR